MEENQDIKSVINIVLASSLFGLWLLWLWSRRNLYLFALRMPGSFGFPIIGSYTIVKDIKFVLDNIGVIIERCKSKTICAWLGLYPCMFTSDPEIIEQVLSLPELINKAETFYAPLEALIGRGLVTSPAPLWQHKRKMINPSFNHKVLTSFFPVFHKGKQSLLIKLDKMAENGEHLLAEEIQRTILGITIETTMGKILKAGEQMDLTVTRCISFILQKIVIHMMLSCINLGPLFRLYFKYQKMKNNFEKFICQLLEENLKRLNNEPEKPRKNTKNTTDSVKKSPNIFVDQAIELYKQEKFSYDDIFIESKNIVGAAFETSASAVFTTLVMLAMHPEVQQRLFDEILNVFPEKNFEVKCEHLEQLPYLDMVINETLRLVPSIPLMGRQVVKDLQLTKELILPKDLQIFISIYHLHRDKNIWGPRADIFDPDNFLPENLEGKHPYSFMPFSKGKRNCIGWRYAMFAIKVIVIGIVRNYRLATSMKYDDLKLSFHLSLKYVNEPSFKIYRRP